MKVWPFHHTVETRYWIRVLCYYAIAEAGIQLLYYYIINQFSESRISLIELHGVMWVFQCLLIWPVWWVARMLAPYPILAQVTGNILFYILYSYCWFGPVQDAIAFCYNQLVHITRPLAERMPATVDKGSDYSYLNYQLLKHAFRLAVFYLAAYYYKYHSAEKQKLELAVSNRELKLRMLKWHLNPGFYFKTISYLQQVAAENPARATSPILQLSGVMEYVIYETREKFIEVKKEISFLENYIQLLNHQPGNQLHFSLHVQGEYAHLKIMPLQLSGLLDSLLENNAASGSGTCLVSLVFSGHKMNLEAYKPGGGFLCLPEHTPAIERLKQTYPGKFNFSGGSPESIIKISIRLDEHF